MKKLLALAPLVLTGAAMADVLVVPVNYNHPALSPRWNVSVNFALPAVASIDSITVDLAHTWGADIDLSVSGTNGSSFVLLNNNTMSGGSGNWDAGLVAGNSTLGNVAPYEFQQTGTAFSSLTQAMILGGESDIQAQSWTAGPLAAATYTVTYDDQVGGDGGSVGNVTIVYTVPAPGAMALLGLAGLTSRRRRA